VRFDTRPINFGDRKKADEPGDAGQGIPSPCSIVTSRRMAGLAEAKAILDHLPEPNGSLHALCTARIDLADILEVLIGKLGECKTLAVATLGYNDKNLRQMLRWLDSEAVKSLTLLSSIFFRSHKGELWLETLRQFRERDQFAACCHSHAKVVALDLCGNGSGREQFCLIRHDALHDWHAAWIKTEVAKHAEGKSGK
jgi:hypothetical protein